MVSRGGGGEAGPARHAMEEIGATPDATNSTSVAVELLLADIVVEEATGDTGVCPEGHVARRTGRGLAVGTPGGLFGTARDAAELGDNLGGARGVVKIKRFRVGIVAEATGEVALTTGGVDLTTADVMAAQAWGRGRGRGGRRGRGMG